MRSKIIVESISPNGNIEAFVEQDAHVAFFYLRGSADTEFGVRSCWVRNLRAAPAELDAAGMVKGHPPMLPRRQCSHQGGARPLSQSRLRVVWFEEGDAAALLEDGDPIAVIPPWSGYDGFGGYARDCLEEGPLCWPFTSDNVLRERIRSADEFWASWDGPSSPWEEIQESQLDAYTRQLGKYEKYYGIDGGNWPPKALLRTPVPGGMALTTVGVGLRPQPRVEMAGEAATPYRRIELGIGLSGHASTFFERSGRYLSAQSNLPWDHISWLGHGHTVPCDAFTGTSFTAILLTAAPPSGPNVTLPSVRGDAVTLLWMVPITEVERRFAIEFGSEALSERLSASGVSWLTQTRSSVVSSDF